MLEPPYNRDVLEAVFSAELAALGKLLAPVLSSFDECQAALRTRGFRADAPLYEGLFGSKEDHTRTSLNEHVARTPRFGRVDLPDLVELYPNRMLQFLSGWPTARATYLSKRGDAFRKDFPQEHNAALDARWKAFAAEANSYTAVPMPAGSRGDVVHQFLNESLHRAGFQIFPVSRGSMRKWHPRPSWVDTAVGIMRANGLDLLVVAETPRPRKYALFSDAVCEPHERGTHVDEIWLSLWAVPQRNIPELASAALKIRTALFLYYWDFFSGRGLRRIIDAHVAAASILLASR
jgi:hypothetical protein